MIFSFEKYHGAGNDFILVDNRAKTFPVSPALISAICHRRFGLGADGLMLLETATDFDFGMRYFNADGGEGSMCGNGGRCITAFARHLGIINNKARFIAVDGPHESEILTYDPTSAFIKLKMQDVAKVEQHPDYFFIDTGSPHHIIFTQNLSELDVVAEGKKIRYGSKYPTGSNVDFVEMKSNEVHVRTYERGVEDETLACGTGATAVALAICTLHPELDTVKIHMPGGILIVNCTVSKNGFTQIFLEGPTVRTYSGTFDTKTFND